MSREQTGAQADDTILQLQMDLIDILQSETGAPEPAATALARTLVTGLRARYGGMRLGARGLYIPALDKVERDKAIRRDFNGTNAGEIMRRYRIGRSRLYQIIKKRPAQRPSKSPLSSHESAQRPG